MKGIVVYPKLWLLPKRFVGITIFPFILFKDRQYATDVKINHEQIHIQQQLELLVVFFYIAYILNFIANIISMNPRPYRNISFEREAYNNEKDLKYLETRKRYNWIKLF